MYSAYVLLSEKAGRLYKGSTQDVEGRVKLHNAGKVKSTKGYRPWRLIFAEQFGSRSEAFRREQYWKTVKGGIELQGLIKARWPSG